MKILVIDDSALWIKQAKALLEPAGYLVVGYHVTDPESLVSSSIDDLPFDLDVDALLIDKDLGRGMTSTPLICTVRDAFPQLPIVRWTGGYDSTKYMQYLGVSSIAKPTKKSEDSFVEAFNEAFAEQRLILSGPLGIRAALDETVKPDKWASEGRAHKLEQIAQIAQLAYKDRVPSGNWEYPWMITGRSGGVTKHELGHCICDGVLTIDDIRPHFANLQKVIAKFEAAGEIDDRFRICAEFIKAGNLDELEFVHRCY